MKPRKTYRDDRSNCNTAVHSSGQDVVVLLPPGEVALADPDLEDVGSNGTGPLKWMSARCPIKEAKRHLQHGRGCKETN